MIDRSHFFPQADVARDVTIVTVAFDNAEYLIQNAAFVRYFNRGDLPRWIIVDNSPKPLIWAGLPSWIEVVPGVSPVRGRDRGSLHHAMGLEEGLRHVHTRYVLLMDPDFYVIRKHWLIDLAQHISQRRLALFGSMWHPKWHYQYRYFPSVHFMWIDGGQLPLESIDLKPRIHVDLWWRLINQGIWPMPVRKTLQVMRIRDTGWSLYQRVRGIPTLAYECLIPHFVPDGSLRYQFEVALRPLLPEFLCLYPKDESHQTAKTYLKNDLPEAFAAGWEEFFWGGRPFAFHLRQVGRLGVGHSTNMDLPLLKKAFNHYRKEEPS